MELSGQAKKFWELGIQPKSGTINMGGFEIPVTPYLYNMAMVQQKKTDLLDAKKKGEKINILDSVIDLFGIGLVAVASGVDMDGGGYERFSDIYDKLFYVFDTELIPITKKIVNEEKAIKKIDISIFPSNLTTQAGIQGPIQALIDFINEYLK